MKKKNAYKLSLDRKNVTAKRKKKWLNRNFKR